MNKHFPKANFYNTILYLLQLLFSLINHEIIKAGEVGLGDGFGGEIKVHIKLPLVHSPFIYQVTHLEIHKTLIGWIALNHFHFGNSWIRLQLIFYHFF